MATEPPAAPPAEPGEPSNRWPWVALALGVLIVVVAGAFYLLNRPRTVNITVEGTPSANPVARAGAASPPPTLVPPTLPASATLAPSPTPLPSATPPPSATPLPPTATPAPPPTEPPPPPPTQAPAAAPSPPPAAAAPPPAPPPTEPAGGTPVPAAPATPPVSGTPTQPPGAPTQPTSVPAATARATPSATARATAPSPTAFAGQVANAGGAGNTRADFDAAYGPATGETPEHLVVYRKNNLEYHVRFASDPSSRAELVVEQPAPGQPVWSLDQAMAESRKLLPKDVQPPNPQPEGSDQFVVQRFTSQSLAQALPPQAFADNRGQPGQLLAVYVREQPQQARISRLIVGAGNDPQVLSQQGR